MIRIIYCFSCSGFCHLFLFCSNNTDLSRALKSSVYSLLASQYANHTFFFLNLQLCFTQTLFHNEKEKIVLKKGYMSYMHNASNHHLDIIHPRCLRNIYLNWDFSKYHWLLLIYHFDNVSQRGISHITWYEYFVD